MNIIVNTLAVIGGGLVLALLGLGIWCVVEFTKCMIRGY